MSLSPRDRRWDPSPAYVRYRKRNERRIKSASQRTWSRGLARKKTSGRRRGPGR